MMVILSHGACCPDNSTNDDVSPDGSDVELSAWSPRAIPCPNANFRLAAMPIGPYQPFGRTRPWVAP
jgi:hypothetical protein